MGQTVERVVQVPQVQVVERVVQAPAVQQVQVQQIQVPQVIQQAPQMASVQMRPQTVQQAQPMMMQAPSYVQPQYAAPTTYGQTGMGAFAGATMIGGGMPTTMMGRY